MSLDHIPVVPNLAAPVSEGGQDPFQVYLRAALTTALTDWADRSDGGQLEGIHRLCRRTVLDNWSGLTPMTFMREFLWCVGSAQKIYDVRLKYYWPDQLRLFRNGDSDRIARERDEIRKEWALKKCYLSRDMVESVIEAATKIYISGWDGFRANWLLLPADPESEREEDWRGVHTQFCKFREVDEANAWYLVRNLYGGRFLKPDVHILGVARHFFGHGAHPLAALRTEAKRLWLSVCQDARFLPLHLGELDYMIWWHKRKHGLPREAGDMAP
jgi:hypothetical protein